MKEKTQKKKIVTHPTIQIVKPKPKVSEIVKKLADKEGRSVGRQAEQMLLELIEIRGYK